MEAARRTLTLQELRVRGSYLHHKEIKAAQGIKIAGQNLESAVAGTQMLVVQKGDSLEDLKEEVMGDMVDIFKSVDKSGELALPLRRLEKSLLSKWQRRSRTPSFPKKQPRDNSVMKLQ